MRRKTNPSLEAAQGNNRRLFWDPHRIRAEHITFQY
jgi:hypothetical protein